MISEASVKGYFRWECSIFLRVVKVLNKILPNRRDILNLLLIKAVPRLNIAVHFVDIMAPVLQGIAWKQPNISRWRQREQTHVHRLSSEFFIVVAWDVVLLSRRQRNSSSWQQTREIVIVNSTVRFAARVLSGSITSVKSSVAFAFPPSSFVPRGGVAIHLVELGREFLRRQHHVVVVSPSRLPVGINATGFRGRACRAAARSVRLSTVSLSISICCHAS
jgi:hypothetical protein